MDNHSQLVSLNPNRLSVICCEIAVPFELVHHLLLELHRSLNKTVNSFEKFEHHAGCTRKTSRRVNVNVNIVQFAMQKCLDNIGLINDVVLSSSQSQ